MAKDIGITELDKLIHSVEFENQQYVRMIDKESQMINSLQTQMQEKIEQTQRLEEEISRFDEDTKRLHKQYTSNRDNITSLKSTQNVMSDHELALTRQLEIVKAKTEENSKFYQNQLANYMSIRDDYMKKYKNFPLALELDRRNQELSRSQKKLSEVLAIKQDLKENISSKEDELDSKVMSRIVVKMTKTKLKSFQLEKEIYECLTEKTELLEKLKEIQASKQAGQENETDGELQMDTDYNESNIQQKEESKTIGKALSVEIEDFATLNIKDNDQMLTPVLTDLSQPQDSQGFTVTDQNMQHSDNDEYCIEIVNTSSNDECFMKADNAGEEQHKNESSGLYSYKNDLDNAQMLHRQRAIKSPPKSWKVTGSSKISVNSHTSLSLLPRFRAPSASFIRNDPSMKSKQFRKSQEEEEFIPSTASAGTQKQNCQSKLCQQKCSPAFSYSSPATSRLPVPKFKKGSPNTSITNIVATEWEVQKPPSLRMPKFTIPKPPKVPPPPPVLRHPPKIPEEHKTAMSTLLMKQLPPPPPPPAPVLVSEVSNQITDVLLPRLPRFTFHPSRPMATTTTDDIYTLESKQSYSYEKQNSGKEKYEPTKKTEHSQQGPEEQVFSKDVFSKENHEGSSKQQNDCSGHVTDSTQPLFKLNREETENNTGCDAYLPKRSPPIEEDSANLSHQNFFLGSLFSKFDNEDSDEVTMPSLFKILNFSLNKSDAKSTQASPAETSFVSMTKFTGATAAPSPDYEEGPIHLLNLFGRSEGSDSAQPDFAINLTDDESDKSKRQEGDKESFFSFTSRNDSDEEGEPTMFNLF